VKKGMYFCARTKKILFVKNENKGIEEEELFGKSCKHFPISLDLSVTGPMITD
jgi:hypothetical protein